VKSGLKNQGCWWVERGRSKISIGLVTSNRHAAVRLNAGAQSAACLYQPGIGNSLLFRAQSRRSGSARHRWWQMFAPLCASPPRPRARVCPLHNPDAAPLGRSRSVGLNKQKKCTPRARRQPGLETGSETCAPQIPPNNSNKLTVFAAPEIGRALIEQSKRSTLKFCSHAQVSYDPDQKLASDTAQNFE